MKLCGHREDNLVQTCKNCVADANGKIWKAEREANSPSLHKLYDMLTALYAYEGLGLTYQQGKPVAVKKSCASCAVMDFQDIPECASKHFTMGCGKWKGVRG